MADIVKSLIQLRQGFERFKAQKKRNTERMIKCGSKHENLPWNQLYLEWEWCHVWLDNVAVTSLKTTTDTPITLISTVSQH